MQPKLSPESRFKHSLKSTPKKQRDYGHFRSDDSPSPLGTTDGGGDSCSSRFMPVSRSRFVERLFPPPSPYAARFWTKPALRLPRTGKGEASASRSLSASLPSSRRDAARTRGLVRPPGSLGCAASGCAAHRLLPPAFRQLLPSPRRQEGERRSELPPAPAATRNESAPPLPQLSLLSKRTPAGSLTSGPALLG